jgi:hypothetical protein
MPVRLHRPAAWRPEGVRILGVMYGINHDADRYRDEGVTLRVGRPSDVGLRPLGGSRRCRMPAVPTPAWPSTP